MPYSYTNGDGLNVLLTNEPDGDAEAVYVLDDAIRQIKAYLKDPLVGPNAKIDAINTANRGFVQLYAGSTPPDGWLSCDGSAISRTTYAALFALIGTTYGSGDNVTTFNVPDLRGRVPTGIGTGDAPVATSWAAGQKKGSETHKLIIDELPTVQPEATLPMYDEGGAFDNNIANGGGFQNKQVLIRMNAFGGDVPHNNIQPSLGMMFIIKY